MYKINVNGKREFEADLRLDGQVFEGLFGDGPVKGDLVQTGDLEYHLLYKGRSFNIQVVKNNHAEKTLTLRVNSEKVEIRLADKYDQLLHQLGMDQSTSRKVNDVKAPMPGMVLNILVGEGEQVKKGDALLVLEAMKMENILKSPCDGTVKRIAASKGSPVEKNQILIQF